MSRDLSENQSHISVNNNPNPELDKKFNTGPIIFTCNVEQSNFNDANIVENIKTQDEMRTEYKDLEKDKDKPKTGEKKKSLYFSPNDLPDIAQNQNEDNLSKKSDELSQKSEKSEKKETKFKDPVQQVSPKKNDETSNLENKQANKKDIEDKWFHLYKSTTQLIF